MRRSWRRLASLILLGWAAAFLLGLPGLSQAGERPAIPAAAQAPLPGGVDRQAIERELARSPGTLQNESGAGLRAYLLRLEQVRSALENAPDLSPSERRTLSDRLLARLMEVGLMLRSRAPERPGDPGPSGEPGAGPRQLASLGPAAILADNSLLAVTLLGGVIVAFALGNLVGYRRGARQAAYYGEGDPRIRFLARPPSRPAGDGEPPVVTLARIRERLAAGCPVQLQLGYEIAPSHRPRFLELMRQAQRCMQNMDGQRYTVWEDPRHPNRFYEVLVCRDAAVLAPLTSPDGPLARIAEQIEACRVPGGAVVRRVWWEVSWEKGVPGQPPSDTEEAIEWELGE